jgi:hypothetical protein
MNFLLKNKVNNFKTGQNQESGIRNSSGEMRFPQAFYNPGEIIYFSNDWRPN